MTETTAEWLRRVNINPESKDTLTYFHGLGRRWRIIGDQLEVAEPDKYFDRWANSGVITENVPKSFDKFVRLIAKMVKVSDDFNNNWSSANDKPQGRKSYHKKR